MFRLQFSMKTMLWLTLVAASFFGGMSVNEKLVRWRQQEAARQVQASLPNYQVPIGIRLLDRAVRNGNISQPQAEQILRGRFLQLADEIERGQHPIRVGLEDSR